MKNQRAFLVIIHPSFAHHRGPGEIIGVRFTVWGESTDTPESVLCYLVLYEDGGTELYNVNDKELYKIVSESDLAQS